MNTKELNNRRCGGTLVEVMMACVVLGVIAFTGAAYVYQSMMTLAVHRDRAVAVARAKSWMEEMRAGGYRSLTQQMVSSPYTVVSNGAMARLEFWAVPGLGGSGRDAVRITVMVTNRPPDAVSLITIYAQE
jgi:Tfp pilus assembly protein PilV